MRTRKRTCALAFGLCAILGRAAEPGAQIDELFDVSLAELLDQTVVTATKSEQKLSDTPATVRVVTAQQIRERGYRTLDDALADLPGLQFRNIQGFNNYVFMRGAPNQNNLILLLVDGVKVNELNSGGFYSGGQFNLENVKQIEVVYGPGSALYGTNAVSGIINIITWSPRDEAAKGSRLSLGVGSFDTQRGSFRTAYYDAERDLGYSFSGMAGTTEKADLRGERGDYNWTDGMENFEDDFAFDGKLCWQDFTVGFLYQDKQASRTTNYQAVGDIKFDRNTLWHVTFMNIWLRHEADITERLTLNSLAYYRDTTVHDDTIGFIDRANGGAPGRQAGYFRPNTQVGVEEQFSYRVTDRLQLDAGLVWEKERLSEGFSRTNSLAQAQDPPTPDDPNKLAEHLVSAYLQSQVRVSDGLELTAGLRVDDSTAYDDVATPRCGLVYHREKLTAKLLYSEAFRAPKPWDYNFGAGNSGLRPEEMQSYEASLEYRFGPSLHAGLALYHNEISDLLTFDAAANRWENQGSGTTTGLELTADYTWRTLVATVNYTFNDSEDDDGEMIPEIARHDANIGLTCPIGEHWKLNTRCEYLGRRKNTGIAATTGSDRLDDAFVVHTNLNFHLRDWDVDLGVHNLLNTTYYHTSNRPPDRYRQPQRMVSLTVRYVF